MPSVDNRNSTGEDQVESGSKLREAFGNLFKSGRGASLVAQWLGVHLPMRGTRVRALVWEDPTCRGATSPVSHSY